MALRIERYKNTRHWALYDGQALVVVTVYRRGAQEVLRRLAAQPLARAEAAAEEAAQEAAAQQAQALAAQARPWHGRPRPPLRRCGPAPSPPGRQERRAADAARPARWTVPSQAPPGQAGRRRDQRERHCCPPAPLGTRGLARGELRLREAPSPTTTAARRLRGATRAPALDPPAVITSW